MVKRATIHVSSRTKKNHPKNGGLRGIKRKQQIQPIQDFTTKLPLQEKQVAHVLAKLLFRLFTLQQDCSRRSVVTCCKSCFSCFRYSAGSIEEFRPREALLHVVKVVLVVFPTQQAASKQYDTTLSIHLRCPSVPRMKQKTNSYE